MSAAAGNGLPLPTRILGRAQVRHESQHWQRSTTSGNYDQPVPASASADPRVRMFGAFIGRALVDARERGMSVDEIEERTRVPKSTIYRWKRAEIANPQRELVQQFCEGLGIPMVTASQILGWDGSAAAPTEPEPTVDPDLRAVMRRLNDPNVSTEEKTTIRQMLRYLSRAKA